MTGQKISNAALKLILNRTFKGTPDYSEPSVIKVGTGTTNPTVSDTDLETAVIISGSSYTTGFTSGFPVIDETNLQVKIRAFLNSLEANGNNLTEFGVFNTDGTPIMWSRAVFTAINKSSATEISFVQVDKL